MKAAGKATVEGESTVKDAAEAESAAKDAEESKEVAKAAEEATGLAKVVAQLKKRVRKIRIPRKMINLLLRM